MPNPFEDAQRDAQCLAATVSYFANLFAHDWIEDYFPAQNVDTCHTLVDNIYDEMKITITSTEWLDAKTREAAIKKWKYIEKNVAYDSIWDDFSDVTVTGIPINDVASAVGHMMEDNMLQVGQPVRRDLFPSSPGMTYMTLNAFYYPILNSINMLAGLMTEPMFSHDFPLMLNLASYGYVIGHEITHGFDNNGRMFNGTGFQVDWWTQKATNAFNHQAQCLIDQFNSFSYFGTKVNGQQTLGENIADLGGLHTAWNTYKKNKPATQVIPEISNDKLFWVFAGQTWCQKDTKASAKAQIQYDVHSPGPLRVDGPMMNLDGFADTFQCGPKTRMGKSKTNKKCTVW